MEETIATLLRLINDEDSDPTSGGESASEVGLTDTVRNVLKAADDALTPVQVRDGVIRMGKNENDYTNLLASVHNILKRLVISKEVKKIDSDEGTFYSWGKPRPRWFERLIEAGAFDSPPKTRREIDELNEFIDSAKDLTAMVPRDEKSSGLKIQPRPTRVRDAKASGIGPRPQKTEEGQSLPRIKPEVLEAVLKKKEGK